MIPLSYSVRSIFRRRFSAFATAAGLGLVVFVFAAVLMLGDGVRTTLRSTGSPSNAIFLRKGSSSELTSFIPRDGAKTFASQPGVAVAAQGGKPVASPELFVIFQLARGDGQGTANVAIRGVTPDGFQLVRADTVHLVSGRLPQPATSEVMIGRGLLGRYQGAGLGQSLLIARRQWNVVGVFEAGGSSFESEVWADADQVMDAMHRSGYSTMTVRLRDAAALAGLRTAADADPRFNLEAKREDVFFDESSALLRGFIETFGTAIAIFFAFGATLGAIITMYAQVAARVREIGTLRALGFHRGSVMFSFLLESLILSLLGAVAGCLLATLLGQVTFSTVNFASFTEIRFRFHFAPVIAIKAAVFATLMGILGGLPPALRAARLQIAEATKG